MFDVTVKFRPREIERWYELNQTFRITGWMLSLTVAVCLMPSLLMTLWLDWANLRFVLAILFVIAMGCTVYRFVRPKFRRIDIEPRHRFYSPDTRREVISHSQFETCWSFFQRWQETDRAFEIERSGFVALEPKRLLTDQQQQELRGYLAQIETEPDPAAPPIELFAAKSAAASPDLVAELTYTATDFEIAMETPFRPIDENTLGTEPSSSAPELKSSNWMSLTFVVVVAALIVVFPALSDVLNSPVPQPPLSALLAVITALFPFLLIWFLFRRYYRAARKPPPNIPDQTFQFMVLPDGWFVGNHHTGSFYDWRDVDVFLENQSAWVIGCLEQQILIPKRIFTYPGRTPYRNVLQTAFEFRRRVLGVDWEQRRRESGTAVTGQETGNPFQPPQG